MMDVCAGHALYLPVHASGALLAAGDGEVCGTGLGVPLEIDLRCRVLTGIALARPIVETSEE